MAHAADTKQLEEELAQRMEGIAKSLEERTEALTIRELASDARYELLAAFVSDVSAREKQAHTKTEEAEATQCEWNTRMASMKTLEEALSERDEIIALREAELRGQQDRQNAREKDLRILEDQLGALDVALQLRIGEQSFREQAFEKDMNARDVEMAVSKMELAAANIKLAAFEKEAAEREKKLEKRKCRYIKDATSTPVYELTFKWNIPNVNEVDGRAGDYLESPDPVCMVNGCAW